MKTLIVYHSVHGNTERLAQIMAGVFEKQGEVTLVEVGEHSTIDWSGFDLVVLGAPIHKVSLSKEMKALVKEIPKKALAGVRVAVFETCYREPAWQHGAAAKKMAGKARKADGELVAKAESFFVVGREGPLEEGEEGRAREWAQGLAGEA